MCDGSDILALPGPRVPASDVNAFLKLNECQPKVSGNVQNVSADLKIRTTKGGIPHYEKLSISPSEDDVWWVMVIVAPP